MAYKEHTAGGGGGSGVILPVPQIKIEPTSYEGADYIGDPIQVYNKIIIFFQGIDRQLLMNADLDARVELWRLRTKNSKKSSVSKGRKWTHPSNMIGGSYDTTYNGNPLRGGLQGLSAGSLANRTTEWSLYGLSYADQLVVVDGLPVENYWRTGEVYIPDYLSVSASNDTVTTPVATGSLKSKASIKAAMKFRHGYIGYRLNQKFAVRVSIRDPSETTGQRILGPISEPINVSASVGGKSFPVKSDPDNDDKWFGETGDGIISRFGHKTTP